MASVDPFAAYKQQQQEQLQDDKKKKAEYRENLNARLMCGECKEDPPNLTEEFSSGDLVCATCGLVLGDRIIDTRSEWRTFANDENNDDPSRVGDAMNPLLNGSQLETSIAFGEGGRARELHRAQNRSQLDKATKGLLAAYGDISSLCDAVHIPKTVQESAKHIYKMTDDAKLFKGKSQESIIAGCIFIACRQARLGRTFKEIHGLTNVSKKEIGRTFKQLEKFLMTQREHDSANANLYSLNEYENTNSTGAEELCGRYCSQLDFLNPHQVEKYAKALARKSTSVKDLAGRSPLSVAAACIYMICNLLDDPRPSRDIATAAGVSDGTIKTAYKYLYQAKDELIEKSWLKPEGPGNMAKLPSN
ncbi:cyclin-like protein [Truncatella angustata]|uniref:Transcription initiation factor IIB n=1 Tax=Truncatella angustata TaxID=152316 RepID=A0A9P8UBL9_9PEZI|nr:cyclin-like protein [Truncatella angustata]KAH6646247.1 cyclin-like protein [Truncatella angustata]